jgi:hypothetical protein
VGVDENCPTKSEACTSITAVLRLLQEMSKTPSLRQKMLLSLKQQVCTFSYLCLHEGRSAYRHIKRGPQMNENEIFKFFFNPPLFASCTDTVKLLEA